MQKPIVLVLCAIAPLAFAGEPQVITTTQTSTLAPVPIDFISTETAYVFESDVNHGGSFGKADTFQNEFEYGHRFLIGGNWYLHAGLDYSRFDIGRTAAPLPVHLQSASAVIGIDYMHGQDIGAFIQFRPGFYTEEKLGLRSFDVPITLARFWTVQPDKLYILTGATGSFLRRNLPVYPIVGLVWVPNEHLRLMGVPPEPKLIYSVNKQLDLWIGGEFAGGWFRTDPHPEYLLRGPKVAKVNEAVLEFDDYRAGVGATYSPTDKIDIDLRVGSSALRKFKYANVGETYRTDPAPYVGLEFRAKF